MTRSDFIDDLFTTASKSDAVVVRRKDIGVGDIILFVAKMKNNRLKCFFPDSSVDLMVESFDDFIEMEGKWRNLEDRDIPMCVINLHLESVT